MGAATGMGTDEQTWQGRLGRLVRALAVPLATIAVSLALIQFKTDVKPKVDPTNVSCLKSDTLSALVRRYPAEMATAQLTRWADCGQDLKARARKTLPWDAALIATITVGLVWSVRVLYQRRRWKLAGLFGALLTAAYVVGDGWEDLTLRHVLTGAVGSHRLPWLAAVKMGGVLGAVPVVATAMLLTASRTRPDKDLPPQLVGPPDPVPGETAQVSGGASDHGPAQSSVERTSLATQYRDPAEANRPIADGVTVSQERTRGVACSGGGIRSAAFALGALQALDESPTQLGPDGKGMTELEQCRWLSSVSGGSYMAAAWMLARSPGDGSPPAATTRPWARQSPEEDFLRRHSSYLAPGLSGKLWALVWFLLGLVLNVGLIGLAIAFVMLPYGWATSAGQVDRLVKSAVVTLPEGGCIHLPDATWFLAQAGAKLRLSVGAQPTPAGAGAVELPPSKGATPKASATADGSPAVALAFAAGQTTSTTTATTTPSCVPASRTPSSAGLPPSAPGNVFPKGSRVPVAPGTGLLVEGETVSGCVVAASPNIPTGTCAAASLQVTGIPPGSRVESAPLALLALDGAAVADPSGEHPLVRSCGAKACQTFSLPGVIAWPVRGLLGLFLVMGVAMVAVPPKDSEHHVGRESRVHWLAILTGTVVLFVVIVPWVVTWLEHSRHLLEDRLPVASGASGATILTALLAQVRSGSGRSTSEAETGRPKALAQRLGGGARKVLIRLGAWVAGPVLLLGAALAIAVSGASRGLIPHQLLVFLIITGWLVAVGSGADLNEWSLHPYYRDHLRGAYGMRVRDADQPPGSRPLDDPLAKLGPVGRTELVLCATANIADSSMTSPGRPAIPWTFTKDRIGSMAIEAATGHGTYAPAQLGTRFADLDSIWTAVAVSGAAFSPAMGKMNRPERCLFALGNLRLGVWYPNPVYFPDRPAHLESAHFDRQWYETHHTRPWYLLKEAFGLHRLKDPWVYVTDGGHYENLGLVELLRRRCREIYCFDASGDSPDTFGTMAEAMRLAREELNVEVVMRPEPMKPDSSGISRMGVWAGTVAYPAIGDGEPEVGWIVLAKLAVPRTAPFDIVDLARSLPSFPNHPTADQLYTDQKFEAYRALGHHLGREAITVGHRIRTLLSNGQVTEAEAVEQVNDWLCSRPDPVKCIEPTKPPAGRVTTK